MKLLSLLCFMLLILGCRREPPAWNMRQTIRSADVIVLADVELDGSKRNLRAREVIKGRLAPLLDYDVGSLIRPSLDDLRPPKSETEQPTQVLLFYSRRLGGMGVSAAISIDTGVLRGTDGEVKTVEDVRKVVLERDATPSGPNQSLEPTATAVTPRADARVAPAAAVAHH